MMAVLAIAAIPRGLRQSDAGDSTRDIGEWATYLGGAAFGVAPTFTLGATGVSHL